MSPRPRHRRRSAHLTPLAALAGLAVAVPVLALPGGAGPASAAMPTITKSTLHFDVVVGPANDTHCTIVADLYRPSTATRRTPAPAILTTNGFGGSKDDQAGIGKAFGRRGYVVLSYSGLGFGGSGCKITLDDPDWDGKAAKQLVSFLGGSKRSTEGVRADYVRRDKVAHDGRAYRDDPRLGMIGGSYGGQVQFAAASIDPRIDTIIPLITWNDLGYALAPNNTAFSSGVSSTVPGTEKIGWVSAFFGLGIVAGVQHADVDPTRLVGCPNFAYDACRAKVQMDALGYPDAETTAFARHASVASYLHKIRIPTLLVQGQGDTLFNLQEAVATYRALKAQRTPVSMIWQSWGHSKSSPAPGELDLSGANLSSTYLGRRFAAWFDRYLDDAKVDTGPNFSYFRDWVRYTGIATPAYRGASSYPVGSGRAFYLTGNDGLTTSRAAVLPGSQSYANLPGGVPSSYTEVAAIQDAAQSNLPPGVSAPYDAPGTFAAYSTGPLAAAVDVVGSPQLTVKLNSPVAAVSQQAGPAGQLLVFVKLFDVGPDGSQLLVHRLISPVRVADVTKPVKVELPGIVHRFAAGHRLRLVLAGSDSAYKGNLAVLPVTVLTSPTAPGVLTLPVVP